MPGSLRLKDFEYAAAHSADEATFQQAGDLVRKISKPISDMRGPAEYRVHLVGVLVARSLAAAAERARQNS